MIDVTAHGEHHIQLFHAAGLGATSILLTRHEAVQLMEKLRAILAEKDQLPALVPDD